MTDVRGTSGPPAHPGAATIDARWLHRVWEDQRRWVAAVLLAHKPQHVELEDLLQEVAVTLVQRAHEIRDPARVRPWLRTVAVNAARAAGRKQRVRLRLVKPALEEPQAYPDERAQRGQPDTQAEAVRVLDLAQRLHPDYREPLLLRCVRGMSYRQIGDALDLPVTTVETRIARARRMVREEVEFEELAPRRHAAE